VARLAPLPAAWPAQQAWLAPLAGHWWLPVGRPPAPLVFASVLEEPEAQLLGEPRAVPQPEA
jgi:hypothetical protein